MVIFFPNYALSPAKVDPDYAEEHGAALPAGFAVGLYSHEAVVARDDGRAVRASPTTSGAAIPAAIRGWMMTDEQYARLYAALLERGYRLINPPAAYAEAHYLPRAYPKLEGHTPETLYTERPDVDQAWELYQRLRDGAVVLKDHVKSAKHRWLEACFIPAGTGYGRFREILETFIAERDKLFEKGFVLRRYVPLVTRGRDMRGYPVAKECRLFYADGELLLPLEPEFAPPADVMDNARALAGRFASRFMSLDLAQTAAGNWIVIEVGDGGVSGLPASLLAEDFYGALGRRWRPSGGDATRGELV